MLNILSTEHPLDHSCSRRKTTLLFCIILLFIERPNGKNETAKVNEKLIF